MLTTRTAVLVAVVLVVAACAAAQRTPPSLTAIEHVIVIYQENWSFDALLGDRKSVV